MLRFSYATDVCRCIRAVFGAYARKFPCGICRAAHMLREAQGGGETRKNAYVPALFSVLHAETRISNARSSPRPHMAPMRPRKPSFVCKKAQISRRCLPLHTKGARRSPYPYGDKTSGARISGAAHGEQSLHALCVDRFCVQSRFWMKRRGTLWIKPSNGFALRETVRASDHMIYFSSGAALSRSLRWSS